MSIRIGIREVRLMLQDRVESLCRELLPEGRRESGYWAGPPPHRAERTPGGRPFKVWLKGDGRGAWKDFVTGETSDVVDLIALVRGTDRHGALQWAKAWLGLTHMDDRQRLELRRRVETRRAEAADREERREKWKRDRAREIFMRAEAIPLGSPAEAYFAFRCCPLAEVPNLSAGSLRFAPALEWWKGAEYEERGRRREKVRSGPRFPAVVAALKSAEGVVTGVHCTFLAEDGRGKAEVDPPKLMFGQAKGSVIRLSDGPTGRSPEETREAHPLIVTEGIEDGLTMAIGVPEARVWAASSLNAIADAPVWLDCVGSVVVAAQNDWGNVQATEALERALDGLAEHGKPVAAIRSHVGKDFNDLMRTEREEEGSEG